jgi:hypothetical protein
MKYIKKKRQRKEEQMKQERQQKKKRPWYELVNHFSGIPKASSGASPGIRIRHTFASKTLLLKNCQNIF